MRDELAPTESDERPPTAESAAIVEAIVDQFSQALRAGEPVSVDGMIAAHPERADALRALLPAVLAVEELKARRLALSGRLVGPSVLGGRLGDFRIVREIGRGGMGIVYEAMQESLARTVALKVLPQTAFLDDTQIMRFQNEARMVSRLRHPHIVPIHSVGADAGVHYFAMPLIPGVGLDRLLRCLEQSRAGVQSHDGEPLLAAALARLQVEDRSRRGYWRQLASVGADIAEALDHAHRHGVVHRDVKPANILLEGDGKAWITDFGVAKSVDGASITRSGDLLGTLHYVPPEHFDGVVDARGDVYGLGLSLFELAARTSAWSRTGGPSLVEQVRRGLQRTLRQLDRSAPRDLSVILEKATALDPAHRYGSAGLFAADLRRFVADRPVQARPTSTAVRVLAWCRRNRLAAALAASALCSVVGAAVVGWSAYWTTSTALHDEAKANQRATANLTQAEAATRLAESNLEVALASYDQLFAAIAGSSSSNPDPEPGDVPRLPPLTAKELLLLQRVLTFYEQFGKANADHARLQHHAARAFRQAGDIHRWTGELAASRAAYERAIAYHERVAAADRDEAWVITMAGLLTSRGLVRESGAVQPEDLADFDAAGQLLQARAATHSSPRLRCELARLLNTTAVIAGRSAPLQGTGRRGPPWVAARQQLIDESHGKAVEIARELVAADATNRDYLLLLARSHRLFAQSRLADPERAESMARVRESLQILEGLSVRFPEEIGCRCEWIDASSLCARFELDAVGATRMANALTQARQAVAARPGMPDFEELLAQVLRRSGDAAVERGEPLLASAHYEEGAQLRQGLRLRFPLAVHHLLDLLQLRRAEASLQLAAGRAETARAVLEQAIEGAEPATAAVVVFGLRMLERDLVEVLTQLGDSEAVAKVRTRAMERQRDVRGGPAVAPRAR